MKDDKLLRLLEREPDAGMSRLISQYSGLVFTIVRGRMGRVCDSSEIEDCVTDVFLNFRSGLSSFVPCASIKNYLAVIARNTAGMYIRNKIQTDSIDDEDFTIVIPEEGDFTEEVAKRDLLEQVYAEIARMGPPDSDIIIRKYYLGQSSKQIASDLKLSVSNVDVRAHRAIERLRKSFGGKS